jgi:hypothetical protein
MMAASHKIHLLIRIGVRLEEDSTGLTSSPFTRQNRPGGCFESVAAILGATLIQLKQSLVSKGLNP